MSAELLEGSEALAKAMISAGCRFFAGYPMTPFTEVLEGMAEPLAAKVTQALKIPTIGIGASAACDGQILVVDDMLGMSERTPSFVKQYANIGASISEALESYAEEVRARKFPGPEHTYGMKDEN